jgi:mRNA-degrading endonuclease RelE of RelBE toxin-antitoxin system
LDHGPVSVPRACQVSGVADHAFFLAEACMARQCDYICGRVAFKIFFAELARDHLDALRAFDRNRILDHIEYQLGSSPTVVTARRKLLVGATPSFEHVQPVWQVRVGDYRVIYDVDRREHIVIVRAVLHKGKKTTGEIL